MRPSGRAKTRCAGMRAAASHRMVADRLSPLRNAVNGDPHRCGVFVTCDTFARAASAWRCSMPLISWLAIVSDSCLGRPDAAHGIPPERAAGRRDTRAAPLLAVGADSRPRHPDAAHGIPPGRAGGRHDGLAGLCFVGQDSPVGRQDAVNDIHPRRDERGSSHRRQWGRRWRRSQRAPSGQKVCQRIGMGRKASAKVAQQGIAWPCRRQFLQLSLLNTHSSIVRMIWFLSGRGRTCSPAMELITPVWENRK